MEFREFTAINLIPAPVRMVLISLYGPDSVTLSPVLALEVSLGTTHDVEEEIRSSRTGPNYGVVVLFLGRVTSQYQLSQDMADYASQVVVCPWDASEDEERLAPVVKNLIKRHR